MSIAHQGQSVYMREKAETMEMDLCSTLSQANNKGQYAFGSRTYLLSSRALGIFEYH
jgi:hypothetical protein